MLGIHHVGYQLVIQVKHLIVELDASAHETGLFQPSQLLTVRTIGNHALEIALNGIADKGIDLVEQGIGAVKAACAGS